MRAHQAECIGCGREDSPILMQESGRGWLRVDYVAGVGVCSACQPYAAAWDAAHAFGQPHFDLVAHIQRQRDFSLRVFGPGRDKHVIRAAINAIEDRSDGLEKWAGLVMAILDGAWRAGHDPARIALAIAARLTMLERGFPGLTPDTAIEHVREPADGGIQSGTNRTTSGAIGQP